MRTTSYIIIGLAALGAVAAFGLGVCSGHETIAGQEGCAGITIGFEKESKEVDRFSEFAVEVKEYCGDEKMWLQDKISVVFSESDSLERPVLSMSPEWNDYLTVNSAEGKLLIDVDFHSICAESSKNENPDVGCLTLRDFTPSDIDIKVPKGMLRRLSGDKFVMLAFRDMERDSLSMDGTIASMSFYNCRIGRLSMDGTMRTAGFERRSAYAAYLYPQVEDIACVKMKESRVGSMAINAAAADLVVITENSEIGMLAWTDASDEKDQTAMLDILGKGIDRIKWDSPLDNGLNCKFKSGSELTIGVQ